MLYCAVYELLFMMKRSAAGKALQMITEAKAEQKVRKAAKEIDNYLRLQHDAKNMSHHISLDSDKDMEFSSSSVTGYARHGRPTHNTPSYAKPTNSTTLSSLPIPSFSCGSIISSNSNSMSHQYDPLLSHHKPESNILKSILTSPLEDPLLNSVMPLSNPLLNPVIPLSEYQYSLSQPSITSQESLSLQNVVKPRRKSELAVVEMSTPANIMRRTKSLALEPMVVAAVAAAHRSSFDHQLERESMLAKGGAGKSK